MANAYWILTQRQRCDLELLVTGGFSPLAGFLSEDEYQSVLHNMTLRSGALWPIPVTLDIPAELAQSLEPGQPLVLCRADGTPLATMDVTDIYSPDFVYEALQIYGTQSLAHAGVRLLYERHPFYVGGPVVDIDPERSEVARHVDFLPPYYTPWELRSRWKEVAKPIVAFHTRNAMHGAHFALTRSAIEQTQGHLLLHPTTGPTNPGDMSAALRIRSIAALTASYPKQAVTLSTLPLAMRMAGPRETLWQALIRQNFGADYFIVGRAPADPGQNPDRSDGYWWPPYKAHELFQSVASQLRIKPLIFPEYAWNKRQQAYMPKPLKDPANDYATLSGSWARRRLSKKENLPQWFAPKAVREVMESAYCQQDHGLVILFTGLPASGKSTLATALRNVLLVNDNRQVSLLDGDMIRRQLSKGLGFSPEDRREHLKRVGFVSQIIAQHGGIALVSMIAPYEEGRLALRHMIEEWGQFFEIYLSTSLKECQRRDPKGLYAQARSGRLKHMTGIDEPYEVPSTADLILDTAQHSVPALVDAIWNHLQERGAVRDLPLIQDLLSIER